ncbi:MAG: Eco57I restriction-modification methylase domain-containing protein [Blastocatellia bacterium]
MAVPDRVHELIERFKFNEASYRSSVYNETQLRREFLDPFFEELGWDVLNRQGYAEAYKDVIHEDAIKVGGATKAPDYCFRIGGARKFFLEAKKPAVNIKDDISPAFQLRRYAWSAKLPLSILSDFEEFAVYDCRTEPVKTDKASMARILYCRFAEYHDKWGEIAGIFSKQAILKGSFDKYAAGKNRKGTQEVDAAFLKEIESWREALAKNLALRNPDLTTRELNFAVQRTIDRIIFLRICEDRGIERYGQLQEMLKSQRVYQDLAVLFQRADDRYNSGLFHFRKEKDRPEPPDDLTLNLSLDDKPLKDILRKLYYPDSPYEFSVLPADILGQVYERFLGKVIRLTAGHQAKVEEKPEVHKAGGVYYTPTYIVDYIVKQTVGKLCESKTPKEVSKLRILDPACGSGSFLLGAYQYLLDWHRDWYTQNEPEKHARGKNPAIFQNATSAGQGANGEWRLTTGERKRILLNNIYGVDIDAQAVETTKLSLLLKVLEGETAETVGQNQRLFQERALPDLGDNIKCGNSLIGHDLQQLAFFDEAERSRINAFDWEDEFPAIMKNGGFDAVIGNPPYLFITELSEVEKRHFAIAFETTEYRFDVYGLFTELSIQRLLKENGLVSFIIPHTLLSNDSFEKLRRLLLTRSTLREVIDIGPGVFAGAKNETMIFIAENGHSSQRKQETCKVVVTAAKDFPTPSINFSIAQAEWLKNARAAWLVRVSPAESSLLAKLETIKTQLGQLCTINQGLRTGDNERYLAAERRGSQWKPAAGGKGVGRYEPLTQGLFVFYKPDVLDAPRKPEIFESSEKLVVQEIRNITLPRRIIATYDSEQFYCLQSTNVINLRDEVKSQWPLKYLLGLLNCSLVNFYFRQRFSGNNHIASNQLAQIPVQIASPQFQMKMVGLVEQMLQLHHQLANAKAGHKQTLLQRQIDATDRQIDRLVYELYGLTEDEIRIVEGA